MVKDVSWKAFFSDDERYADIINGIGCNGKQVVTKEDLHDMDTQVWHMRGRRFLQNLPSRRKGCVKIRDSIRKVAFGMNFAIIGVENQDNLDYSIPVKCMSYDVGNYEKQLLRIRKETRKNQTGLNAGEFLYGFKKDSKLYPTVTFVLYTGEEPWDGPKTLHDILDFKGIPKELQATVSDYRINLIDIRKLKDTSMFKTDVQQVFDFIRYANDGKALKNLVENNEYYKNMDSVAFDVAAQYTNATELLEMKEYYEKEGRVDMCKGLKQLIAEGKAEGETAKLVALIQKKLSMKQSVEQIAYDLVEDVETVESLIREYL